MPDLSSERQSTPMPRGYSAEGDAKFKRILDGHIQPYMVVRKDEFDEGMDLSNPYEVEE